MKTSFTSPNLSYEQQIKLLKLNNLTILNDPFYSQKLKHINYFRLSAYFPPFYEIENRFKDDAKFEDILNLYYFDKELRALFFYAIEKIEVYVRTQLAYTIAKNSGTFGYLDESLFHNAKIHQDIIKTIERETHRSKEVFVEEFFDKYEEKYLPIFPMFKIASFSTLLKIFSNMKEAYRKEVVQGLDIKPTVFKSWLHTISYVRNISAHHGRLWNKTLAIEPMKPRNQKKFQNINNKKIFFVVAMIIYLLEKMDDEEFDFKKELNTLSKKYPNVDLISMGFVDEWIELELCR